MQVKENLPLVLVKDNLPLVQVKENITLVQVKKNLPLVKVQRVYLPLVQVAESEGDLGPVEGNPGLWKLAKTTFKQN